MNRQHGIALVTTLFILVAVLFLGVSSLFLTRTNLRVAENVRTNAMARNNANSGVEATYLLLESYHSTYDTFPTSANDFTLPSGAGFELSAYRFDNADQVMVRIKGTTSRGAEHESEGLFSLYQPPPEVPETYATGLVSEGEVEVTSNAAIYVDAGVHGNDGFDLGGDFYECTARDSEGNCTATTLVVSNPPVSMTDPNGTCKLGSQSCTPSDYYGDAVHVSPDYTARRDEARDLNGDGVVDASDCIGSLPAAVPSMGSVVVCASGDITLDNAFLTNVTIITDGDITLTGNATLTDTTLISTGGEVEIDSATFEGTRIFSEDDLSFQGNAANFVWNDSNTVATAGKIEFNGSNKNSNTVNPIVDADGNKSVGLVLIAEDDITFNGSNDTNADYYAVWITGGKFTQNGRSSVYGAISAIDDLRFNGNFYIDSGFDISNPDLEEYPDPEVQVLSRR